jgi:hypothetical protein
VLRKADANGPAVVAADVTIDFGGLKIVGEGKAFSLETPGESIPVAKTWTQVEGKPGERSAYFLIEATDYKSIKPKLDKLPKSSRRSGSLNGSRSDLIRRLALRGDGDARQVLQAALVPKPMVLARSSLRPKAGLVLDFLLVDSIPLPSGAISWWPAEDNANDAVGANDGSLSGSAGYAAGEDGQAFNIPGSGSYVQVPCSSSLNVSNGLTIEFWLQPDATNAMNTIQGLVTSDFYGLEISSGFQSRIGVNFFLSTDSGNSWPMISEVNGGGAVVSAGDWHHIAGTYDGSALQLYVDGQPYGYALSHTGNISPMASGSFLALGSEAGRLFCGGCCAGRDFNGLLDEVTIYNRALDASEIEDIYNADGAGKYIPDCVPCPTNAVAWWPAEGDATDILNGHNGSPVNGADFASGMVGQAFALNGTNQYVEVPDSTALNPTSAMTVEAWVKPRLPFCTSWAPVIKKEGSGGGTDNGFSLETSGSSSLLFWLYLNGPGWSCSPSATLTADTWSHFAGVYNGSAISIYLNGSLVGSYSASGQIVASTNSLQTGHDPVLTDRYFNGYIDEPTIYARALSAQEIQSIYDAGSNGKCHSAATLSILTQPTNQTVTVGQNATFYVSATGNGTLTYQWTFSGANISGATTNSYTRSNVQTNHAGAYAVVVSDSGSSVTSSTAYLTVLFPPAISVQPSSQSIVAGDSPAFTVTAAGNPAPAYQWTFDGNPISGATGSAFTRSYAQLPDAGNYAVVITNSLGSVTSSDAVLTVARAPDCVNPPSDLVSWWPAEGTTNDTVGGNNGTWSGTPSYGVGEVGQCFVFDGNGSNIQLGNPANLRLQDFTIEAWLRRANSSVVTFNGASGHGHIFGYGASGYSIFIDASGYLGLAQGSGTSVQGGTPITDTSLHHVAVTKTGSTVVFYVDGTGYSAAAYNPNFEFSTSATIGGIGGTYSFYGSVDELSIYNRALPSQEVQSISNASTSGKCNGGLPAGWQLRFFTQTGVDPNADPDGDGLSNYQEYLLGTDPTHAAVGDTNNVINLQVFTPLK